MVRVRDFCSFLAPFYHHSQSELFIFQEIEFLEPIQCSILSERRVFHPYGMHGGGTGATGNNRWVKQPREADGDWKEGAPKPAPRVIKLGALEFYYSFIPLVDWALNCC